jgi:DNA-binding MarR family transcriptional regulator
MTDANASRSDAARARSRMGRPPEDLTAGQARALRRLAARVEAAEQALAREVALYHRGGASNRAISEELGIAKETTARLIQRGEEAS